MSRNSRNRLPCRMLRMLRKQKDRIGRNRHRKSSRKDRPSGKRMSRKCPPL